MSKRVPAFEFVFRRFHLLYLKLLRDAETKCKSQNRHSWSLGDAETPSFNRLQDGVHAAGHLVVHRLVAGDKESVRSLLVAYPDLLEQIQEAGIEFDGLEDGRMDSILGDSTGAADIFANTGGVMEAALRTAYDYLRAHPEIKILLLDLERIGPIGLVVLGSGIFLGVPQASVQVALPARPRREGKMCFQGTLQPGCIGGV
jgi:hypothetical protein